MTTKYTPNDNDLEIAAQARTAVDDLELARRAVAAVLRAAATEAGTLRAERNRLRAMNAELVAALNAMVIAYWGAEDDPRAGDGGDEPPGVIAQARAVLANIARE